MDAKEAVELLSEIALPYKDHDHGLKLEDARRMACTALSALREQEARLNPKALTPEELRERVGKPVWLVDINRHTGEKIHCVEVFREDDGYMEFWYFGNECETSRSIANHGISWLAYDYPPQEEA